MKIFCTDGTTVECSSFRAVDAGILLFDEEPDDEEGHGEATGFVPITQLRYVLPDDAQPAPQIAQRAPQTSPGVQRGGQQPVGSAGGGQRQSPGGMGQGPSGPQSPQRGQQGSPQGPPGPR